MALAGLVVTLLGFLIAVGSLGMTDANGARLGIVVAGILVSLAGIVAIINPAYQKNAVWKK